MSAGNQLRIYINFGWIFQKKKKRLKGDVSVGTIPVGQDTFLGQGTQDGYQG